VQEFGTDAAQFVADAIYGQQVALKVHSRDIVTGVASVSVWNEDLTETINEVSNADALLYMCTNIVQRSF
jgi:hypothetical protein